MNKMDDITTKMAEYICDNICRHTIGGHTEEGLEEICDACILGDHIYHILNEYEDKIADQKEITDLLEEAAEEIQNLYGRDTDLTERLYTKAQEIENAEGCQTQKDKWILCSEKMPEERDSIFAKWKGTDKWNNSMFEKTSDDVNATIEFEDGKRTVKTLHTIDGKWNKGSIGIKFKVIAWQPFPEPCKEMEDSNGAE
ncbi:MAG: DUF551 domain-containing protein [Lachnospiraceae bacterium]|nr:DUF551 domain-containing protein [Lachnospiraceae bacterium]